MTDASPSAAEPRAVIWTTNVELQLTSLSGYGLVGPKGDASMHGQSVGTLAPRDAAALTAGSRNSLSRGPQVLEVNIAGLRHHVRLHPLPDGAGGTLGTVGVALLREESALEYQTLVEASPYCIHTINAQRQLSTINPVGLRMLGGLDPEQILGRPYVDFAAAADAPLVADTLERGFAGETVEVEFRTTEGKTMRSSVIPVRDESGAVTSLLGFSEDVSPRIEVLSRLMHSEERHRALVQNAPYCIHEINKEGCLTSMNPAGLDMMGVDDESAIVGLRYLDIIVDADRPRIAELLHAANEGQVSMFEFEATNGQHFQSNFIPILDHDEQVVRMMGLTQNITERKLAQHGLEASERRLGLALRGADLGLWDLDLDTGVLAVNERWASLLADTSASFEARMERVHPEDRAQVRARLDAHLRGESDDYVSEHRVRSQADEWRWIHERGAIVERDDAGAPRRLAGVAQDRTQQRRLETQLQQSQKMDSIGQLAGGVAHDFNNLLVAILGHSELAQLNLDDPEELLTNIEEIHRAAERAAELTRRLLVFSRQQRIERRNVELNECVAGLVKMLGRLLPETIELRLELDDALPRISADLGQLEQIIVNLCVNARDAMPEGGRLTISTRPHEGDKPDSPSWVTLEIRDEGEGMDEATLARIFEPFFTTKPAGAGTGLGLSMVYGIVTQHGGTIEVDCQPGRGSAFLIRLPATNKELPLAPPVHPAPAVPAAKGEMILVVEDDELVRKLVVSMLGRCGYTVHVAEDGQAALEFFERPDAPAIDLVLMDVVMPRMGGYEARKAILGLRPGLAVLMTSGYVGKQAQASEGELDTKILVKPYAMDTLARSIRSHLNAARAAAPA